VKFQNKYKKGFVMQFFRVLSIKINNIAENNDFSQFAMLKK